MKKLKFTSLTAAALATTALATTNLNNHTVKADSVDNQTATKGQTPKEVAQTNVDNAKNDVTSAQNSVNQAQSNLNSAQDQATTADSNYSKQSEAVSAAQNDVNAKSTAVKDAQSKADSAASLASEAKDPSKVKAANEAVSAAQNDVDKANAEKKAADQKVADKNKEITTKSEAVTKAQQVVDSASAVKSKADKAVAAAENALKGTGINEAKTTLDNATKKLNDDKTALTKAQADQTKQKADYDTAKSEKDSADKALKDAQGKQKDAETTYNNLSKKFEAQKNAPQDPVLVALQNKLNILQNDASASISISDVEKYKKAWQDWKDNKFDDADIGYIKSELERNFYKGNDNDNEVINITNLTDNQAKELATFGVNIINNIRKELGIEGLDLKVTDGSVAFARAISKRVQEDYASGKWVPGWHDAVGINEVADKSGMYGIVKKVAEDGVKQYANVDQPYEDGGNNDPGSHLQITMGEAKQQVYDEISLLTFAAGGYGLTAPHAVPTYEFGHASGILNADLVNNQFISISDESTKDFVNSSKKSLENAENNKLNKAKEIIENKLSFAKENLGDVEDYKKEILQKEAQGFHGNISVNVNNKNYDFPHDLTTAENDFNTQIADLTEKQNILKKGGKEANDLAEKIANGFISHVNKGYNYGLQWENDDELKTVIPREEAALSNTTEYFSTIISPFGISFYNIPEYAISNKKASQFSIKLVPTLDEQIADVQKQIKDEEQKKSTQPRITKEQVTAAKTSLDTANTALTTAKTEASKANTDFSNAQSTLKKTDETISKLEKAIEVDTKSQSTASSAYNALTKSNKELAQKLENTKAGQTVAENKLKNANSQKQGADNALKNANTELSKLKDEVTAAENNVKTANKALEDAKQHVTDLNNASEAKQKADADFSKAQEALNNAKSNLKTEQSKLPALEKAKKEADAAVATAQANLDAANTELETAQTKLKDAQDKLESLNNADEVIDSTPASSLNSGAESTKKGNSTDNTKAPSVNKDTPVVDKNGKGTKSSAYAVKKTVAHNLQIKLTHNAFVYDKNGKVIKNKLKIKFIRRGKTIKPLNAKVVTIKGKKYYQVGKNQFIKIANAKIKTHPIKIKAVLKGKKNLKAVDLSGKVNGKTVKAGKKYHFNEKRTINGKTYYKIAWTNNWIAASKLSVRK